jgi:hypothetical protein
VEYPVLAKTVLKIFLTFPATCECEAGFQLCFKLKPNTETIIDTLFLQLIQGLTHLIAITQGQPAH